MVCSSSIFSLPIFYHLGHFYFLFLLMEHLNDTVFTSPAISAPFSWLVWVMHVHLCVSGNWNSKENRVPWEARFSQNLLNGVKFSSVEHDQKNKINTEFHYLCLMSRNKKMGYRKRINLILNLIYEWIQLQQQRELRKLSL